MVSSMRASNNQITLIFRILASIGSPDNLTITFSETASCNGPKVTTSVVQNLISESAYISSINPGENDVILDFNETSTIVGTVNVAQGSVSTLVFTKQKDSFKLNKFELTSGNYVHILWQLPQYILLTAGEIMFSITGNSLSFFLVDVQIPILWVEDTHFVRYIRLTHCFIGLDSSKQVKL